MALTAPVGTSNSPPVFPNCVTLTGILKFLSSFLDSRHDSPSSFLLCAPWRFKFQFSAKSVIVYLFVVVLINFSCLGTSFLLLL